MEIRSYIHYRVHSFYKAQSIYIYVHDRTSCDIFQIDPVTFVYPAICFYKYLQDELRWVYLGESLKTKTRVNIVVKIKVAYKGA